MNNDEIEILAGRIVSKMPKFACPEFNKKQLGTLRVAANVLRVGVIAFLTGMGMSGAGLLLYQFFHVVPK